MKLSECPGYQSLLAAVQKDTQRGEDCFDATGCHQKFYDNTQGCRRIVKCFHQFCDKFAWVIARAEHYAEKTGLDVCEVLNAWEAGRSYWYMNYYQDANQPLLTADHVRVFDSQSDLLAAVGVAGFRCPTCGGVSTSPYECTTGLKMSPGKLCDWKSYGLFGTLGKGVFVFVKEEMRGESIFMPVAFEKEPA